MAYRSSSQRSNYLNNENAHKVTKEVAKVTSGPTLSRAILGDRTNIQKKATEGTKKQNVPFKKHPHLKGNSKKAVQEKSSIAAAPQDATMMSLNSTELETTGLEEMSAMSIAEANVASTKELVCDDEEMELLAQSFSNKLLTVVDIDRDDTCVQLVREYVNEIYAYMRDIEDKNKVKKHYLEGAGITPRMRLILVDWLVQVHSRFNLMQETLFLTICILDRYLQEKPNTAKEKLQLVGVTAMFIASKYEEMWCAEIGDFVFITDKSYTAKQIREMEVDMLKTLDFYISFPLPLHFLRRNSKAGQVNSNQHTLAKYLIELVLPDYAMSHYKASEVAAAALFLTLKLMGDEPEWTDTLYYYSAYNEQDLLPIACKLAQCVIRSHTSKQTAIQKKYESNRLMKISLLPALKGPIIRSFAEKAASYT